MKRRVARLSFLLLSLVSFSFTIAICQDTTPPRPEAPPPPGMAVTTMRFGPSLPHQMKPVTGAPYCADEVFERVQTLADGTHITSNNRTIRQCRDSAGRTRREEPIAWGRPESMTLIHIDDPVANVRYILDPQNKIAHRHPLAREKGESTGPRLSPGASEARFSTPAIKPGAKSDKAVPQTISESLGKETIEGVTANGRRTTTTYPVGSVGNDKEFTSTHEYWMSSELHLEVLSKTVDPRYGEDTHKMVNISTSEPDPALFQVPEGYTMDDDDEFRVEWRTPPQ